MCKQVLQEVEALRDQLRAIEKKLKPMTQGYARPLFHAEHPQAIRVAGVKGGEPTNRGTGKPVQGVVDLSRQMGLGQLLTEYKGELTPAHVFDALSYYYDHPGEIDRNVTANQAALERTWQPCASSQPFFLLQMLTEISSSSADCRV